MASPSLDRGVVELWRFRLDDTVTPIADPERVLSPGERAKVAGFALPHLQRRYRLCRTTLRAILGSKLCRDPGSIHFRYSAFGQPFMCESYSNLAFNVTHSSDVAIVAVASASRRIGVDAERHRHVADAVSLARLVFSASEQRELAAAADVSGVFLNGWTRKEACLKAIGTGLSSDPAACRVPLGQLSRPMAMQHGVEMIGTLYDLSDRDVVAALVVEGPECELVERSLDELRHGAQVSDVI